MEKNVKKIINKLYGVLVLEDIFLHKHRKVAQKFFGVFSLILILVIVFFDAEGLGRVRGLFLISFSFFLTIFSLESYFYSFYKRSHDLPDMPPFEVASILFYSDDEDITKGFLFSEIGDRTFKKLGITEDEIKEFLSNKDSRNFSKSFSKAFSVSELSDYTSLMFEEDIYLKDFLLKRGINLSDFTGAFEWAVEEENKKIEEEMWWSKNKLFRIPPIGKNWSYGQTFILERYGEDITDVPSSFFSAYEAVHDKNVLRLESILSKKSGANCIITSDDESSRMDILYMLSKRIRENISLSQLAHKRVFVLNANLIIENSSDKISLERDLTNVLVQAENARNVILVIPYFSAFLKSASALGVDVVSVISPFLSSRTIHIVALDSKSEFHSFIENKTSLMEHFEVLKIDIKSGEGIMAMLKEEAESIEKESHILVTYTALVAISQNAKQYFDAFAYADKAKDILFEVVSSCATRGIKIIFPEHINEIVSSKTGIPTGTPKGEEKNKLLNLEKILHERVVGQEEAIKAISEALRRSRAGVRNTDKPIGSFLFLGPTGVGKTETTKALAQIFFDSEKSMSRLDMSEYKNADALGRLIGSFEENKAGILSTLIREKPYGVLLLDEFEKTNQDVLNLFLQILDEGFFGDSEGKKVNVRNNIIIATSNAGSELIWDEVKKGNNLALKKDFIIEQIVASGIFKPELLNRFDGVILFHPLSEKDLSQIARFMMNNFAQRMLEKGIEVEIGDKLISFLVSKGNDPKFGARPMNRAIASEVENLFAEKIIAGEIVKGSKVSFEIGDDSVIKIKVL